MLIFEDRQKKQANSDGQNYTLQRKPYPEHVGGFVDNRPQPAIQRRENHTGLPDNLKQGVESLSGMDISRVRVHRNSSKPATLNAHAYTQGNNIYLGHGQEQHLAHEAWHAVQQSQGRVRPTLQLAGNSINDDNKLEKEADVMGNAAFKPHSNHHWPAMVSPIFHTSGTVTQCKLKKWQHPVTGNVTEGLNAAEKKADVIDNATEDGFTTLQQALKDHLSNKFKDWSEFKNEFSFIGGDKNNHVRNFANKLNDYRGTGYRKIPAPNKEAGYIIEEFASHAVKSDPLVSTQYIIGGSRPDFRVITGETHLLNATQYKADAFVDITSQAEAFKGHILDKITKVSTMDDVKNHPHLWDCWYDPIDWGGGAKAKPIPSDADMQDREQRKKDEAEAAKDRRESTRASKRPKPDATAS